MTSSPKNRIKLLEDSLSVAASFILTIYGITKRTQFGHQDMSTRLSELKGNELMWTFYGYSKPYALIIGGFQILAAALIIFRRTRIIGCLLASSILVNIILQDIFYHVSFHALAVALQLQLIVLIILWLQRERLMAGLQTILTKAADRHAISYGWLLSSVLGAFFVAAIFGIASVFLKL